MRLPWCRGRLAGRRACSLLFEVLIVGVVSSSLRVWRKGPQRGRSLGTPLIDPLIATARGRELSRGSLALLARWAVT